MQHGIAVLVSVLTAIILTLFYALVNFIKKARRALRLDEFEQLLAPLHAKMSIMHLDIDGIRKDVQRGKEYTDGRVSYMGKVVIDTINNHETIERDMRHKDMQELVMRIEQALMNIGAARKGDIAP